MALFTKKKTPTEPVEKYAQIEQDEPQPAPVETVETIVGRVLSNQTVIVQNQQTIVDMIGETQTLMLQLAREGVEEPEEEEEDEEEEEEAVTTVKKKKKAKKKK